ncbi:hypothetical protein ACSBR2_035663 [Camellia fascicularis]
MGGFGGLFSRMKRFGGSGASAMVFSFGHGIRFRVVALTKARRGCRCCKASAMEGVGWVSEKRRVKQEEESEWCKKRLSMFRGEAKEVRSWVVLNSNGA